MENKSYLIATVASCLLAFAAAAVHAQSPQVRYNLISIVTDDQAHWSIGVYGNRESRTPNMDRLAREGALFTNAFVVTPVCSPSRASFLTGRYGTQLGITDWVTPQEARDGLGLPIEATTWPEVLQRHGYVTGLIGKWHLGALPQFHPTRRGYHHFLGFLDGGSEPMHPTLEVRGKRERLSGSLPDILTDDAMTFVEDNRQSRSHCRCTIARHTCLTALYQKKIPRHSQTSTRRSRSSRTTTTSR